MASHPWRRAAGPRQGCRGLETSRPVCVLWRTVEACAAVAQWGGRDNPATLNMNEPIDIREIQRAHRRELIRVTFERGLDIRRLEAVFWITQGGGRADIVIKAG